MKDILTRLFWPILRIFETDKVVKNYKSSYRAILVVVGLLFVILSIASAVSAYFNGEFAALIPVVVFLCVGMVALVVGTLGSDAAVSKIWGRM
jgi:hypothetical protein